MIRLVRGAAILVLTSLFVAFIYAQTRTESPLAIANDSQVTIKEHNSATSINYNSDTTLIDTFTAADADDSAEVGNNQTGQTGDNKKLVKKTASVSAVNAGASRGAFTATAYCFSGRTAMGHAVRRGLVAADPRVLKLGSRIYVSAGQWSGTYLVSDTGGAIKGKRLDIWVPGCAEARKFGRRTVTVNVAN